MGNTDTLHPNSCFCSFSIPTFKELVIIHIITSNKNFILDVEMEKEQKQELGWRVSVLPILILHSTTVRYREVR